MIKSFKDKNTEKLFKRESVKQYKSFERQALRRLEYIEAASCLHDLSLLPGNNLEKLVGDRKGQHSIRINNQWRVCFIWNEPHAENVEIVDYH